MNPKHREKIHELCDDFCSDLKTEAERLYKSGGIDPEAYNPDEYALAKIIITASIENRKYGYKPLTNKHRKELQNLLNF